MITSNDPKRYLLLSDLHFGSGDELLTAAAALERLEPELESADAVILNGDVWDFIAAPIAAAIDSSRRFFKFLSERTDELIYLPGNHDYHFVARATDQAAWAAQLESAQPDPYRLGEAEQLLKSICPGPQIRSAYPLLEIAGSVITHGHYISPHLRGIGWQMTGRVSSRLAGLSRRESRLGVSEYEALLGPLQELFYEMAQLPSGRSSWEQNERLLTTAANILRAPGRLGRRIVDLTRSGEPREPNASRALFPITLPAEAVRTMELVCRNLDVEADSVCFGHTHSPFAGLVGDDGSGRRFYNSGSWMADRRERDGAHYDQWRHMFWPGTVLRIKAGEPVELRGLLEDLDHLDLRKMLPATGSSHAGGDVTNAAGVSAHPRLSS